MTEQVVEIFSNRLDEVLTEVGTLFGRWDTMPREERCPKALAALEKMAELARDADEVSTYLQEAYPPIRLTADEGWRERLNLVWEMIRRVMDKRLSVEEGTMSALLDVVIPDERDRKRIADTMVQVTSMEDLLLTTLSSAFSHLHDLLLALRAALDADRTETLALLYAKAEARYTQEVWREGEKGGEWDKFIHHMQHVEFPWELEPTYDQLQVLYKRMADKFNETELGEAFLECDDDPLSLGSVIASVECTKQDLDAYFREIYRLREVRKLAEIKKAGNNVFENTSTTSKEDLVVAQILHCFYGNRENAVAFLMQIKGAKPTQITALVKQWIAEKKISELSCHRDLWKVLHDNGYYPRGENNWNSQVG